MVSFFLVAHNRMLPSSIDFGDVADERESNVFIFRCLGRQALQVRQTMDYQRL